MAVTQLLAFFSDVNDIEFSNVFTCVLLMVMWSVATVFSLLPQFWVVSNMFWVYFRMVLVFLCFCAF
jgi:hypothetical protein